MLSNKTTATTATAAKCGLPSARGPIWSGLDGWCYGWFDGWFDGSMAVQRVAIIPRYGREKKSIKRPDRKCKMARRNLLCCLLWALSSSFSITRMRFEINLSHVEWTHHHSLAGLPEPLFGYVFFSIFSFFFLLLPTNCSRGTWLTSVCGLGPIWRAIYVALLLPSLHMFFYARHSRSG